MNQRITDHELRATLKQAQLGGLELSGDMAEHYALDLRDARVEIATQEHRLQEIGDAAGTWEWATWNDLVPLVQIKMARLKEAEAEIKRLERLSASQEEAHALRDKGLL